MGKRILTIIDENDRKKIVFFVLSLRTKYSCLDQWTNQ